VSRQPSVESKGELIKVGLQMLGVDRAMMGAFQPSFQPKKENETVEKRAVY
jgi:hypothetical protein